MWSTGRVKALRPLPEFLEPLGVLPAPAGGVARPGGGEAWPLPRLRLMCPRHRGPDGGVEALGTSGQERGREPRPQPGGYDVEGARGGFPVRPDAGADDAAAAVVGTRGTGARSRHASMRSPRALRPTRPRSPRPPRRSQRPRRPTTRPVETHPAAEPTARHPLPPPICPAFLTVQVVLDDDTAGDGPTEIREVFTLHRGALSADTLGLQLAEAKDLLGPPICPTLRDVAADAGHPTGESADGVSCVSAGSGRWCSAQTRSRRGSPRRLYSPADAGAGSAPTARPSNAASCSRVDTLAYPNSSPTKTHCSTTHHKPSRRHTGFGHQFCTTPSPGPLGRTDRVGACAITGRQRRIQLRPIHESHRQRSDRPPQGPHGVPNTTVGDTPRLPRPARRARGRYCRRTNPQQPPQLENPPVAEPRSVQALRHTVTVRHSHPPVRVTV